MTISKIYTRNGDQGKTTLFNGCNLSKSDPVFSILAYLDKISSLIGVCISMNQSKELKDLILDWQMIQKKVMAIGSVIAQAENIRDQVVNKDLGILEEKIDYMMKEAGDLKNLILPGGSILGAHLHLVRSETRFLELEYFKLVNKPNNKFIGPYLNRLSDYFFAAARYVNMVEGGGEIEWKN